MSKARVLADYVAGGTTAAEFDYLDGVTSNIQTQMNLKAPLASPTLVTPALGTPASGVMTNMTGAVTASLVDNAVTLAKMAGGSPPAFEAVSAGKVLQVVKDDYTAEEHLNTTSSFLPFHADFGVSITCANSSNQVLLLVSLSACTIHDWGWFDIQKSATGITDTNNLSGTTYGLAGVYSGTSNNTVVTYIYLDTSAGTTNAIKYSPTGRDDNGNENIDLNNDATAYSSITAIEIAA